MALQDQAHCFALRFLTLAHFYIDEQFHSNINEK